MKGQAVPNLWEISTYDQGSSKRRINGWIR